MPPLLFSTNLDHKLVFTSVVFFQVLPGQKMESKSGKKIILRRNPPDVGVTSRQKPCTKIIYIVLQTSVGLF